MAEERAEFGVNLGAPLFHPPTALAANDTQQMNNNDGTRNAAPKLRYKGSSQSLNEKSLASVSVRDGCLFEREMIVNEDVQNIVASPLAFVPAQRRLSLFPTFANVYSMIESTLLELSVLSRYPPVR